MAAVAAPRAADTIAAVTTASGPGGVGIVRLSGPDALAVASRVVRRARVSPQEQPPQTLRRAVICDPESGEEIDDILLAVFRAPHSFTGEDVAELQGHGGDVTVGRVLTACLRAGARPARPGEFSERAFLNGQMDLSQAEGIAALVAAQTVAAQRAARRQVAGELSRAILRCAGPLRDALARIEASIDFPEEVGEIDPVSVDAALERAQRGVADLLATFDYGRRLSEGVTVVLAGRPNVGKSSLLNALSGRERAIVTEIAGTTRDVIEEALNLNGIPVRALDTAGIRETVDPVERIGVVRAHEAIDTADVVVAVLDATSAWQPDDERLLAALRERCPLLVIAVNKADAANPVPMVAAARAALVPTIATEVVVTAAPDPGGVGPLRDALVRILSGPSALHAAPTTVVTSVRHAAALREAEASISSARRSLTESMPAELIAVDAHGALQALGQITGETAREEIIAGIFSRFCIGK